MENNSNKNSLAKVEVSDIALANFNRGKTMSEKTIYNYNPKDNLKNLQKAWRQDEYALRAIFGNDSFYQVLLKSWPEDKKEAYVKLINKKYNKEVISKADLHIADESNSNSHIYIKEMKKDTNGNKNFVASHFILYTKTLIKDANGLPLIDVQRSNITEWANSNFICFVWKYEKGNLRILCKTTELMKYLLEKGKRHTENKQSFISCTVFEAISNHIVKAQWDTKVIDSETGKFDPLKWDITVFEQEEGRPNDLQAPKRNSELFSKVDAMSRMYEGKAHVGGTKLYFPDGTIKHYELQKDALKDICSYMAMNSMPYSNTEKTKMSRNLKSMVQRSSEKVNKFNKGTKQTGRDNSIFETGIYAFSGEITNENIMSFMKAKVQALSIWLNRHDSVLVNKCSNEIKEKEIKKEETSINNNYYLKDTVVSDKQKDIETQAQVEYKAKLLKAKLLAEKNLEAYLAH